MKQKKNRQEEKTFNKKGPRQAARQARTTRTSHSSSRQYPTAGPCPAHIFYSIKNENKVECSSPADLAGVGPDGLLSPGFKSLPRSSTPKSNMSS